ncbi:hypothetical protein CHELA1G11_12842 [Hyphomicrobiales bacterium]|nr:hypothetical protein CHELA1G2_11466 [Hyphomicrobiales bacterium]CAH1667503.1 hypothetical protein CHELA1G11_12842 [Hyphomicrobiales bacterium]
MSVRRAARSAAPAPSMGAHLNLGLDVGTATASEVMWQSPGFWVKTFRAMHRPVCELI